LLYRLYGQPVCLEEVKGDKRIVGIGLSDFSPYARRLEKLFNYKNTYYHKDPLLDITDPPRELWDSCDFLISSDVFEHVVPPVERAFVGAFRLLKPGGIIVLTVPFTHQDTVEHFPNLHCWDLVWEGGKLVLYNRTREGVLERFENLRFHGGEGATLEFRVFGLSHLLECFVKAGFVDVRVHREDFPDFGILGQTPSSVPISARKPLDG
jgi:SAM-dependent methyltransferase